MVEHVSAFVQDEMDARGWDEEEMARQMGPERDKNLLLIGMILHVQDRNLMLDQNTATRIARAFGTSPDVWVRLDKAWRAERNLKLASTH